MKAFIIIYIQIDSRIIINKILSMSLKIFRVMNKINLKKKSLIINQKFNLRIQNLMNNLNQCKIKLHN